MKTALVTLSIPSSFTNRIFNLTEPFLKYYANKIGAEYIVIDKPKLNLYKIHYEKFQVYDILKHFDRIIYMDNDIIIDEDCPNLFSIISEDKFGAVYSLNRNSMYIHHRNQCMASTQREWGNIGWTSGNYNSGVMVFSKRHRHIFNPDVHELRINPNFKPKYYEQDVINYRLVKSKTDIRALDNKFNHMLTCKETFEAAYVKHFAGQKDINLIYDHIKDYKYKDKTLMDSFTTALTTHLNII